MDGEDAAGSQVREVEFESLEGEEVDQIRALTDKLGGASEAFAARRMDKSIREALAGASLDDLEKEVGE